MEAAGKRYIVHPSRSDELVIYDLADIHDGNRACALSDFKRDRDRIRDDPNAFWVGGGDYGEYISVSDRRFASQTVAEWITVEDLGHLGSTIRKHIRDLFQPIKHKCLGLLLGNHEISYARAKEQEDMHSWLCVSLGVPNLGYCALLDIVFVRKPGCKRPRLVATAPGKGHTSQTFRLFLHHGAGYAQTEGGKINKLVQFMRNFDADIYMVAHVHDQTGKRVIEIAADSACTKLIDRQRLGIITGSYLKTYAQGVTGYGEIKGYRPVPLGARFVSIRPETREMKAEI